MYLCLVNVNNFDCNYYENEGQSAVAKVQVKLSIMRNYFGVLTFHPCLNSHQKPARHVFLKTLFLLIGQTNSHLNKIHTDKSH